MADVEQVGGVVSEPALSLFTKPEYEGVMVGAALASESKGPLRGSSRISTTGPTARAWARSWGARCRLWVPNTTST